MSDVTKVLLNNQIVLMRRAAKRSKLHLITRLVRAARKLSTSGAQRGDEAKPMSATGEKLTRKKETLLKEIKEIKKLAVDEISKFCLIQDKQLSQSLRGATVSDKDRALAKLADHKFIKDTVTSFRGKFPSWKVQIPSIYSMWAFKEKFSKMMSDSTDSVKNKRSAPARQVAIPEAKKKGVVRQIASTPVTSNVQRQKKNKKNGQKNVINTSDVICGNSKTEVTMDAGEEVKPAETKINYPNDVVVQKFEPVAPVELTKTNATVPESKKADIDCQKIVSTSSEILKPQNSKSYQKDAGVKSTLKSKSMVKKFKAALDTYNVTPGNKTTSSEMVVKRLNLTAFAGDGEFFVGSNTVDGDSVGDQHLFLSSNDTAHGVKSSSFFINSDGEAGSDSEENDEKSDGFRDDFADAARMQTKVANSSQKYGRNFDSNATKPRNRFERRALIRENGSVKSTRFTKKLSRFTAPASNQASPDLVKSVVEEKLHPSWEAKRKLTQQSKNIVAFQGSKITFDDDD